MNLKKKLLFVFMVSIFAGQFMVIAEVIKTAKGFASFKIKYTYKEKNVTITKLTREIRGRVIIQKDGRYGGKNNAAGRQIARKRAVKYVIDELERHFNRNNGKTQYIRDNISNNHFRRYPGLKKGLLCEITYFEIISFATDVGSKHRTAKSKKLIKPGYHAIYPLFKL